MVYRIVRRITMGANTVGYELIGEDNVKYRFNKDITHAIAREGYITNAKYNENSHGLNGVGVDLRAIPSVSVDSMRLENSSMDKIKRNVMELLNNSTKYACVDDAVYRIIGRSIPKNGIMSLDKFIGIMRVTGHDPAAYYTLEELDKVMIDVMGYRGG